MSLQLGDCLETSKIEFSDFPENDNFHVTDRTFDYQVDLPDHSCEASIYLLRCLASIFFDPKWFLVHRTEKHALTYSQSLGPREAESSDFEEFENYQRECFAPYGFFALRSCAENCFRIASLMPGDCLETSKIGFSDFPENDDFLSFGTGHPIINFIYQTTPEKL